MASEKDRGERALRRGDRTVLAVTPRAQGAYAHAARERRRRPIPLGPLREAVKRY